MTSPYYRKFLGIRTETDTDGALYCTFDPGPTAIGREGVMHGGAVASLLEASAFALMQKELEKRNGTGADLRWQLVTTTIDYLRPGLSVTSFAQAEFQKLGGRSASVGATAWNKDRSKPVATAEMTFIFVPAER